MKKGRIMKGKRVFCVPMMRCDHKVVLQDGLVVFWVSGRDDMWVIWCLPQSCRVCHTAVPRAYSFTLVTQPQSKDRGLLETRKQLGRWPALWCYDSAKRKQVGRSGTFIALWFGCWTHE